MSQTFDYTGTFDLGQLSDEFVAAGITPETIRGSTGAIDVVVGDGVLEASVDAVVTAHVAGSLVGPQRFFRILDADSNGADTTNAQPWFPSRGSVYVHVRGTYAFSGLLHMTRSLGTNSHTTSLLFGGTAGVGSIRYEAVCNTGDTAASEAGNVLLGSATTALVVKGDSTDQNEVVRVEILRGIVRFGSPGTFIPQFQYSAAPGGAPAVQENSHFILDYLGSDSVVAAGTWS